ncbi:MAG: Xaa-Pro peptidase family protein [Anaerolineae bacterium]
MNSRLAGLCRRISAEGISAALVLHPRDVLYYAGTARPVTLFVVCGSDATSAGQAATSPEAILFVRRGLERARMEATVDRVESASGFSTVTNTLAELGVEGGVLGIALDVTSAQLYRRLKAAFAEWELVDISSFVLDQRTVKDADEIATTRRAAAIADVGHCALPRAAAPGVTELELAAEVERAIRLAGHEAFQPLRQPGARGGGVLLASGENLAVRGGHGLVVTGAGLSPGAPYGASRRELRQGDLIVLDIGSTCGGYTADESRTFVLGQPTDAQQALFDVTYAAEGAVLDSLRPGVPVADVHEAARAVVARGAPPVFAPGALTLPGFVGHGIGLELDEPPVLWPRAETRLQEGMVLAIEVEVSAPGQSLMTKLEDTVVIRSDGCEILTHAPRELIQCA